MLLPERIDTARCWLRPFQSDDLDDLFQLYGDPEVMTTRKIGVQTREGTASQLAEFVDLWQKRRFGLYAGLLHGSRSADN